METKIRQVAGGVVIGPDGRIVVVEQEHNTWSLPKGGIDYGEDDQSAAKREVEEESGIPRSRLQFIKKIGTYERYKIGLDGPDDKSEIKKISMFLFKTSFTVLEPHDSANPSAIWLTPDQAVERVTHRKDKEFLQNQIVEDNLA